MGFNYQRLQANEIRLLKPLSRFSSPPSFEIVHVSLLSKPHYSALSYTWGPPGDVQEVHLNGQYFPIRQNLHDAIQQIQSAKLIEQYLWVDAICIDQGEDEAALKERSVQITLMTQIYEQAKKVLVWLGKAENGVNNRLAFRLMKDLHKRFRQVQRKARPYRPWWWQAKARTNGEDLADFVLQISPAKDRKVFDVPGSETYKAWLGIVSIWKSPWWKRAWVFQEATIPERVIAYHVSGIVVRPAEAKVKFLCSDQETDWKALGATLAVATAILSTPGIDSKFLVGVTGPFDKLRDFRAKRVQHLLPFFLETLQMFRHTECLDPRDKVYAPLGMASEEVRHFIRPDYSSKTSVDVYTDVVQYCLAQPGHHLDFLGHAMYQPQTQILETPQGAQSILPSWVPNFSATLNLNPIPKVLYVSSMPARKGLTFYDKRGRPSPDDKQVATFCPLGDTRSQASIVGNTLRVSGIYLDVLKDIIREARPGADVEAAKVIAREKGRQWATEMRSKYFTGEGYADAYNRTLVLDLVYDEFGRPSERGGKYDNAFSLRPRAELSLVEYRYQMNMKGAQTMASASREMGFSRKQFLLYIPNTAEVGDKVFALAGGQALYILRSTTTNPFTNRYRYIGECYAHGLMDGDIVRRLHQAEVRMEDVILV